MRHNAILLLFQYRKHHQLQQKKQFQMDIESSNIPLFQALDNDSFNRLLELTPSLTGAFAFDSEAQPSISLSIFHNNLVLRDQNKKFYNLNLSFEIKLEIIYLFSNDVTSEIIGFRLHNQNSQSVPFYSTDVVQFTQALGKILNMKGFQQMFKPVRRLGKGNFATVYEAERTTDHERFAVKAFSKQNSYSSKNGKQSLMNELSLLRSLNVEPHPNVLRLEAVYESDNSIYVVLELLEGKTLLQTIQDRKGKLLSPKEIKTVMEGLLKGVAHLCQNRVMHRDLKPENVMVRKDSLDPVIVDFGLSTNVDLPEYLFFRCGTPGYVAPEIIQLTQSIHLEPTCDVFSLGAVFHLLLTNQPLFPGVKYDEVYKANKRVDFSFDKDFYNQVKQHQLELLKEMLVIDANSRITAEKALKHPYFSCEETYEEKRQTSSPALTQVSNKSISENDKPKKKKRFFFF